MTINVTISIFGVTINVTSRAQRVEIIDTGADDWSIDATTGGAKAAQEWADEMNSIIGAARFRVMVDGGWHVRH
jgi:hypothetical protein